MSKLTWAKDLLTLALIPADCSVLRTPTILISIYLTIFRDKKKALRFGDAARAIRKTASSTLSAASQLIFAHKMALPSYPSEFRFSCKHGIWTQKGTSEL